MPSVPQGKDARERPTAEPANANANAEDTHVDFRHLVPTPERASLVASRDGEDATATSLTPGEEMLEEMPKEMCRSHGGTKP
eukprot:11246777-Alexandrium_andersonii.AAC.1